MKRAMVAIEAIGVSLGTVQLLANGGAGAASPRAATVTTLEFIEGFGSDTGRAPSPTGPGMTHGRTNRGPLGPL